jgi:lipid II:glycine glycyltransferase (peptidoglycan interpeptide bridge formation enzyme)
MKSEYPEWLLDSGFKYCQMHDVDAEITWTLDLTKDEELIIKEMRDSTRYLIRKGQKTKDLEIIKSSDANDLKYFWEIYQDTVKRQKWHAYSYEYIKEEFLEYVKNGKALLFLAKYQGKYIASSIFLYEFGQTFYHHSGSLSEFKKIPAMYLLHWESILEAKRRGCNKYNFFGIAGDDDPKHPWAGLTLFKKGFGGEKHEMIHALDYPITKKYWVTYYYEKLERKFRGYK